MKKLCLVQLILDIKSWKNVIKGIIELAEVAAKEPISIDEEIPEEKDYLKLVKGLKKKLKKLIKLKKIIKI